MRLLEHEGKKLLTRHGIAVPRGRLLHENDIMDGTAATEIVLKCQILEGSRGKAGLVRRVDATTAGSVITKLRASMRERGYTPDILVEDVTPIEAEYYACVRIDDVSQRIAVMFSPEGGIDVENSTRIAQILLDPLQPVSAYRLVSFLRDAGAASRQVGPLSRFLAQLCGLLIQEDALQIEINPLALTEGNSLIALDAKIELDDSSSFRHTDRLVRPQQPSVDPLESAAAKVGITFVKLSGNVALLTGGAGLGMGIVDELSDAGLKAANFIDTPAGVNAEKKIDFVLERAKDPEVELIGIYVFQTAQPLSRVIGSLLDKLKIAPLPKPVVVGVAAGGAGQRGMSIEQARDLMGQYGIPVVTEIHEFVEALQDALNRTRSS